MTRCKFATQLLYAHIFVKNKMSQTLLFFPFYFFPMQELAHCIKDSSFADMLVYSF